MLRQKFPPFWRAFAKNGGNVEIVTNNGLPVVDEPATGGKSVYVLRIVRNMSRESILVRNSVVALSKPSSLLS